MEVGLSPGYIVLNGDSAPLKGSQQPPPQFLAHVYCGQMAGWIEMPLGMDIGLGPGHNVFDGIWAPPKRGTAATPPLFSVWLLWPNGHPCQQLLSSCWEAYANTFLMFIFWNEAFTYAYYLWKLQPIHAHKCCPHQRCYTYTKWNALNYLDTNENVWS